MRITRILTVFLFPMLALPVYGQNQHTVEQIRLSLDEAIQIAQERGFSSRIAYQEIEQSGSLLVQTRSAFLPSISIEETAVRTTDPVGVFGIRLRQGIATAADFNPAALNAPDPIGNFTTRFQIQQPIFNPESIMQRSVAKQQFESSKKQYRSVQQHTILTVKELYTNALILDRQLQVLNRYLVASSALEQQASDYYEQGIISKAEYLSTQVQRVSAEQHLIRAKNQRKAANDELTLALGYEKEMEVVVSDGLQWDMLATGQMAEVPTAGPPAEIQALAHQVEASKHRVRASRSGFLPSLHVFGNYELHDNSIFGNQADNYTIGANLRWDLFKGFRQVGKIAERKAELRKVELVYEQRLAAHHAQVREVRRQVDEAQKNIELSNLAVEQAKEDARIRNDRYTEGIEKTSDLLSAEARLLENELNHLKATFQWYVSIARLEYLLETEFISNK